MTQPTLHVVEPDDLPGPRTDDDSCAIVDEAIEMLSRARTAYWLGDSGIRIHAMASLIAEAQRQLPQAIRDARDQELTWDEIAQLLGTSPRTAQRRAHQ